MGKYWLFRIGALVLPLVPPRIGHALAGWVAELVYLAAGKSRRAVLANLRRVLGPQSSEAERRRLAREVFRTSARNYFDLFRLPRLRLEELDSLVRLEGFDRFEKAVASGKGVVIVSAHFGNFDLVGQILAARHYDVTVPVLALKPPALLELVTSLRASKGVSFVPLGPAVLRSCLRTLQRGGVVGLAADRDLQHNGILVPFFGEEASLPTGAVELARRTGALLLPALGFRGENGTYAVFVEPPLDPQWTGDAEADRRRVLGQVIAVFERYIRTYPGQWVVFEPIWKE